MTSEVRPNLRIHRPGWAGRATRGSLVVAVVAALAVLGPTVSAYSYRNGDPVAWSNGVVLCQFATQSPSVAVSHSGVSGTGVTVSLASLVEATRANSVVGVANLSGLSWSVTNLSTDDAYDIEYSAHAAVVSPSSSARTLGSVQLTVQFVLPAYQGSPKGPTDRVSVLISVVGWSWQGPTDHLVLAFEITPSYPASEHLNATEARGWILSSTSNESGQVLEQVGANASAQVTAATGPATTVAANASVEISSPSWAELSVAFGDSAGAYTSLSYDAEVGIVIPTEVAGIPLSEIVAVIAAGAFVSVVVAVATRRVRRRPSKLIYVTEAERP
jgi:hypothetical protein